MASLNSTYGFDHGAADLSDRGAVISESTRVVSLYAEGDGGSSSIPFDDGETLSLPNGAEFVRYDAAACSELGKSDRFDALFSRPSRYKMAFPGDSGLVDELWMFQDAVSDEERTDLDAFPPSFAWVHRTGADTVFRFSAFSSSSKRSLSLIVPGKTAFRNFYSFFGPDGGSAVIVSETAAWYGAAMSVPDGDPDSRLVSPASILSGARGSTVTGGTPSKAGFVPLLRPDGLLDNSLMPETYQDLENRISRVANGLESHRSDTGNPHSVTKAQVGLGNADNTSDMDKPVSAATQEALDDIRSSVSSVFKFVGFVEDYPDLPTEGNRPGDVYGVESDGMNVVWVEDSNDSNDSNDGRWDDLGASLSGYATKEEVRFEAGAGADSAVQKQSSGSVIGLPVELNSSVSTSSVAEGAGNVAGLRGYRYTDTGTVGNSLTFAVEPDGWAVGDFVSVINKSKYPDAGVIASISGKTVTFESGLNIGTIVEESDFDSKCAYVSAKPDKGDVDLGAGAHAEGVRTRAVNTVAHAEGRDTAALGQYSHAEGRDTSAQYIAHAEGHGSVASGMTSHAEGYSTVASALAAHAEGNQTVASGQNSHASGLKSVAEGYASTAMGRSAYAMHDRSFVWGGYDSDIQSKSHGAGSFTVNPAPVGASLDPATGFWIGEKSLASRLDEKANKTDLGTAASKDAPASGNAAAAQVVLGSDTRLSDARTPTAHTHFVGDITLPFDVFFEGDILAANNKGDIVPYSAPQGILAGNNKGQIVAYTIPNGVLVGNKGEIVAGIAGTDYVAPSSLAAVATSGSYNDLTDKPTIPAAQIQSDWNQTDSSAKDFIKNKPEIPTSFDRIVSHDGNTSVVANDDGTATLKVEGAAIGDNDPLSDLADYLGLGDNATLDDVRQALGLSVDATLEDAVQAVPAASEKTIATLDDVEPKLDAGQRNIVPYAASADLTLDPEVAVYRLSPTGTAISIPSPVTTALPATDGYYQFEIELAVPATATSLTAPSGWTWLTGYELPSSGYAGKTVYVSCRMDLRGNAVTASCWRVA